MKWAMSGDRAFQILPMTIRTAPIRTHALRPQCVQTQAAGKPKMIPGMNIQAEMRPR